MVVDPAPDSQLHLEAVRHPDGLCIYVRDAGPGLRPNPGSQGLGVGLPLMARMSDQFELRTTRAGGTEIVLRFPMPSLEALTG
jgi:anti-sigma regulatory factor (Ser/Thr protein kinase)